MGIIHLEDLPAKTVLELMDLQWSVTEKLDGSYIKFGLDHEGKAYVARHNDIKIYNLDDWPDECWTSGYRPAHLISFFLLESLKNEGVISPGDYFGAEIINNNQPNCIEYILPSGLDGLLRITSVHCSSSTNLHTILLPFQAEFTYHHPISYDGIDILWKERSVRWRVNMQESLSSTAVSDLEHYVKYIRSASLYFLHSASKIPDYTMGDLLEVNLNKIAKCHRATFKEARATAREDWYNFVMLFKKFVGEKLTKSLNRYNSHSMIPEGFVIKSSHGLCKITDREEFTNLNKFVHRMKYYLVGGSRPVRSCFLSRTKDWPLDHRIKRLDVLRNRYLANYDTVVYFYKLFGKHSTMFYSGSLHERMLCLFADTRKRLLDGR